MNEQTNLDDRAQIQSTLVPAYVHTSDIRQFKQCRRKWSWSSPLKENRVPKRTPRYFARGRAFHASLEQYYDTGEHPSELFFEKFTDVLINDATVGLDKETDGAAYIEACDEALGQSFVVEDLEMGERVLQDYVHWSRENDDYESIEAVEQHGHIPLLSSNEIPLNSKFDEAVFSFRTDMIVKRNKGQNWIVDFKTTSQLPSYERLAHLDTDEQITGYLTACEHMYGMKFTGAVFIYILMRRPQDPTVLQNGRFSVSKQQNTSAHTYLNALKDAGLDPKDYSGIINYLKEKKHWFRSIECVRTPEEKDNMWRQLKQLAYEMLRPEVLIYPSPSVVNCGGCQYFGLCLSENAGLKGDVRRVLQQEYALAKPREGDGQT